MFCHCKVQTAPLILVISLSDTSLPIGNRPPDRQEYHMLLRLDQVVLEALQRIPSSIQRVFGHSTTEHVFILDTHAVGIDQQGVNFLLWTSQKPRLGVVSEHCLDGRLRADERLGIGRRSGRGLFIGDFSTVLLVLLPVCFLAFFVAVSGGLAT